MAFNPFHAFRRHKKVLFAGLTIMCMLTFVLMGTGMGGGGDFFSDLTRSLTGNVRQTDVASLYGKDVTEKQLFTLKQQRLLANSFMTMATDAAFNSKVEAIRKTLGTSPQAQQALLTHIFRDPDCITLQQRLMSQPYFGGGINPEDLLDFLIWKHEADRLGITFTDDDVVAEVNRLTSNLLPSKTFGQIQAAMASDPRFRSMNEGALKAALREEMRVRAAQAALTGYEPGSMTRVAAPVTPQEFWEFFKDRRTSVEFGLIPVKVEDYVKDVKGEPTEAELKELYTKFKDKEYAPELADPGFKQPRRVQIQWVAAKLDAPYFKKVSTSMNGATQAAQLVGTAFGNMGTLAGGVPTGIQVSKPMVLDLPLINEYDRIRYMFPAPAWTRSWYWQIGAPIHASSLKDPGAVASTVGNTFGVVGMPGAPAVALTTYNALVSNRETVDRVRFGTTTIGSGTMPGALTTAAMATYGTPTDEYLPLPEVKNWVIRPERGNDYLTLSERLQRNRALAARNFTLREIQKEIDSIERSKDKAMLEAYVKHAIERYGLETGKSADIAEVYSNKFNIADDPGLKAIKEAYLKPPSDDPTGKRFNSLFLSKQEPYQVETWPDSPTDWRTADTSFLFWKTEVKPERVVPLDDPKLGKQLREELVKVWKFRQARELAKAAAEKMAKELQEKLASLSSDEKGDRRRQKLKDLVAEFNKDVPAGLKKELIEVGPIAKQNPKRLSQDSPFTYEPPQIPEDKVPNTGTMGRASPFAEKLVALRDKPHGETLVVADQPDATYYVGVLLEKKDPSELEFFQTYRESGASAKQRDPLLMEFEREQVQKYRKEFIERLRKEAKLTIQKENIKRLQDGPGGDD
ncbi:MAG: hypothetical protein K2R98_24960 [Gemmataceae bacterium]|nr:hypothetical protein [Gemmataceae bacterium]